jgi:hypothetical protein
LRPNENPYVHYGKPFLGSLLATVTIGGFILAVGGEAFRAAHWLYIALHVAYLTVVGFLIWLVFDVRSGRFKLPKVKKRIDDQAILVCEPEDWLGYGASVAVYQKDGDYERPLATGQVSNIQANGLVQVQLVEAFSGNDMDVFREELTAVQLTDFIIKPGQDWRRS